MPRAFTPLIRRDDNRVKHYCVAVVSCRHNIIIGRYRHMSPTPISKHHVLYRHTTPELSTAWLIRLDDIATSAMLIACMRRSAMVTVELSPSRHCRRKPSFDISPLRSRYWAIMAGIRRRDFEYARQYIYPISIPDAHAAAHNAALMLTLPAYKPSSAVEPLM